MYIKTKVGFTLIELLVVVLIIGILAAGAVPQYQLAVEKSRYATLKATGNALTHAQHLYYLEHGQYACSLNDLALDFPSQARCYIVQQSGCTAWGCSLTKKNIHYLTYYYEKGTKYCVVWDSEESPVRHKICQQETDRQQGTHSKNGPYTQYKY